MVKIRWTGAAGLDISLDGRTFLVDPYVTRPGRYSILFKALVSDKSAVQSFVQDRTGRIAGIVASHTHFDHVLDIPGIVPFCRGPVVGSKSLANLLDRHGLNHRVRVCKGGETVSLDHDISVTMIPSAHGRVLMGRVPYPGEINSGTRLPMKASGYALGAMFMPRLVINGATILHAGSAGFDRHAMEGHTCDVLFMCVPGWQRSPGYVTRFPRMVDPKIIVPFHYDDFTRPLGPGPGFQILPRLDMDGFVRAVSKSCPTADMVFLNPNGELEI
ncbi:MAG: MBL fold metallo-hydrolase [Desulfobacteraceae bacterium]|nr:MBL fold metallo-hydrolase [Desulfobacteraceae bacterium]